MPAAERGWIITPEEFSSWIVEDNESFAVLNKPALVVCHPSKSGPWSSLIGAAREYFGVPTIHVPFRLDRETSGVWVAAKNREYGAVLQKAVQQRLMRKTYLAILTGEMKDSVIVDQPIGHAEGAVVHVRREVRADGQPAWTKFEPLDVAGGYTLARVTPATGRTHQIRVHAQWLGRALAGDKIYGPDETLFLDFIEHGYSGRVAELLPLPRHALHCESVEFALENGALRFSAPLASDLREFWSNLCSLPL